MIENSTKTFNTISPSVRQRCRNAGYAYQKLASSHGWQNPDGSMLPISAENLTKYIRYKAYTNKANSIDWWIYCLGKYHDETPGWNARWEKSRNDPKVQQILREIKNKSENSVVIFKKAKIKPKKQETQGELAMKKVNEGITKKSCNIELDMLQPMKKSKPLKNIKPTYESILESLEKEYVGKCKYHPMGCFEFENGGHLKLTEAMLRKWAYCIVKCNKRFFTLHFEHARVLAMFCERYIKKGLEKLML
ncbi:hypothetical protein G9A89_016876 [Geosiphon pyriformis]|nr:hypothetical protein G9A89_016876 [Geosiphon pyriformis]